MKTPASWQAPRITLIFVVMAGGWVLCSDTLLKRFAVNLDEGLNIDMLKESVFMILVAAFGFRILRQRQVAEKNFQRTERALKTISACNKVLVRASSEAMLLAEICRVVVEKGGYRMAWVGFAENDEAKSVSVAASAGCDDGYLEKSKISWDDTIERGRGPTGTAIRTSQIIVCNDFQTNPLALPWRKAASEHGYASTIVLPLRIAEKTFGVMTIYSAEANAFNSTEVELLNELADDLAYGIQALRTQIERTQAEQSLRAAEEKYRRVFESAQDAISTSDVSTGKYLSCNPAALKMFGVKSEAEFVSYGPQDFSPERQPDGRPSAGWVRATDEKVMREGQQFFEWKHRRLDGEEFMADVLLTHMEHDGKPLVLATIRDITQRKKAEETLRESEKKFSKMFHSSPLPMAVSTIKEGRYLDANREFLNLLQRSRQDVIGHTAVELNLWRDAAQRTAILADHTDEGTVRNVVRQIRRPSGQIRDIIWSAEALEVGGERCWLGFSLDITEQKRAEDQMRLQSTAMTAAANAIVITDRQGKIEWVNPAFSELTGYGPAEVMGHNPRILKSGQHPPEFYANLWTTITAGNVWHGELLNQRKDGRIIFEDTIITPVRDADGKIAHFVALKQDITNRKQTERLLSFIAQEGWTGSQGDFLAQLAQYIGRVLGVDYVFIGKRKDDQTVQTTGLYAKGRIVPDMEYSTRGAPCQNVIGKILCHYSDHLQEMFPADALLAEMGAQSYLGIPLTDSTGKPLGLMAVLDTKPMPEAQLARAILQIAAVRVAGEMERLVKVEELHWKTALLEAQMEAAPDGILMVDNQGRTILQNQRLNDLLKIPPHLAADQADRGLLAVAVSHAKDPGKMQDKIAHLYAHPEEISRDELELVDGTIVDRYSSPVRDKAGNSCGRIWTFRDITKARQLEAQLHQSQKMEAIGQLAGGVAHDFNNILSSLMMQADLIELTGSLPAEMAEGMKQIRADANRAAQLTRQLLLFSRRQVMQSCLLDLNEVVTSLAKMLARIIGEDVRLSLNLHPVPLLTHADAGMVEQMLMNLAVNARDAMPKGGRLSIDTAEKIVTQEVAGLYPDAHPGRYVCFSVSDTGTGIPPEIVPQIFEPFFTTKAAGKGTGLGLATVFGIVKLHQGWLKVDNHPGRGATFRIFLPASAAPATEATQTEANPKPQGGKEIILLVEDEASLRKTIRSLLQRHGYTVVAAANGIEALDLCLAQGRKVALLLTDLVMPGGLSGHELARQLQSRQSNLKVIFMSGYSPEIAGREIELRPGENFIQKPFATARLLETIRQSLDG
jgi:PAS domain S-box-containing protein